MASNGPLYRGTTCIPERAARSFTDGVFFQDNPFHYSLPRLMIQIVLVVVTCRALHFVSRHLRQPRLTSDIIGTILLGYSIQHFAPKNVSVLLFASESIPVLRTFATLGLIMHLFLVCVKVDPSIIWRSGPKPFVISGCSIGACAMVVLAIAKYFDLIDFTDLIIYLCVFTCMTAFPVLADNLRELGLLNSEVGRLAMSTSMAGDVIGWLMMVCFTLYVQMKGWGVASGILKLTSYATILLFTVFVFRPWMEWIVKHTPHGGRVGEGQLVAVIATVLGLSLYSEMVGLSAVAGPIFLGLAVPDGPPIGAALVERVGAFPTEVALPLYFMFGGLVSFQRGFTATVYRTVMLNMLGGYAGKILGAMVGAIFVYRMPVRNAVFLSFMLGFTGIVEMAMLMIIFIDIEGTQTPSYSTFMASALITTTICSPVVSFYDPMSSGYKAVRPTIQLLKTHAELRLLMCVHGDEAVPVMLELMEASCGGDQHPLCVYVLRLVELVGRSASSLIAHKSKKGSHQLDHVHLAFLNHEQRKQGMLTVLPFTTISPLETMHQDIYSLANEKNVALVVVPYPRKDAMESTEANALIRQVVPNVVSQAPCSVGILVHHGFNTRVPASPDKFFLRVLVLFWGGPDDREALSYASLLLQHPGVYLTVVHFLASTDQGADKDRAADEALTGQFRAENAGNERVEVREVVVADAEQTITAIRSIEGEHGLVVVGRQQGSSSHLGEAFEEWSESPALGPLGDMLATPDFDHVVTTMLIIQHRA